MNNSQRGLPAACALTRGFWVVALAVLQLLSPVQAQAPDAKPVPTDAARDASTPPTSRNIYIAGGNVRPATPVNGDL